MIQFYCNRGIAFYWAVSFCFNKNYIARILSPLLSTQALPSEGNACKGFKIGVDTMESIEKINEMKLKYRKYIREYMRRYRANPEKKRKMREADKRRWAKILEGEDNANR